MTNVDIWTDGPSSQFKNRFMFVAINKLKEHACFSKLIWNYFATSHGKGVVDGIGGTAKRVVNRLVLSRKVEVTDAATFAKALEIAGSSMRVMEMNANDIQEKNETMNLVNTWKTTRAVPGCINIHCISNTTTHTITKKMYTSSPEDTVVALTHSTSYNPQQTTHGELSNPSEPMNGIITHNQTENQQTTDLVYDGISEPNATTSTTVGGSFEI